MDGMRIDIRCQCCGNLHSFDIPIEDYYAWINGVLIQDAFPYLSREDREMFISGFCDICFTKIFSDLEG